LRRKQSSARVLLAVASFLVLFVVPIRVFAGELIFAQSIDGRSIYGPSSKAPSGAQNAEVADDFDLIASIDRVAAIGYTSGPAADFRGVYVRFYAFGADGRPGALQAQSFVAANPTLTNSLNSGGWLDITLPTPFAATGRHFLSVQPAAATDTSGNANLSTKGARGTYKLTVTNTSKTGYTFDAANSVLTKSITK
jgi:hypothetical protein